jgi:hypothetical protein
MMDRCILFLIRIIPAVFNFYLEIPFIKINIGIMNYMLDRRVYNLLSIGIELFKLKLYFVLGSKFMDKLRIKRKEKKICQYK